MNAVNELKEDWQKIKELIKQKWEDFTHEDIEQMDGKKEKLVDGLVKKYNLDKTEAERRVNKFWN